VAILQQWLMKETEMNMKIITPVEKKKKSQTTRQK
jgi:hypothetical protein